MPLEDETDERWSPVANRPGPGDKKRLENMPEGDMVRTDEEIEHKRKQSPEQPGRKRLPSGRNSALSWCFTCSIG